MTSAEGITVGEGLDAADFATITATTGDAQVTYADIALYYFAADTAPGDTLGEGVGGVWHTANVDSTCLRRDGRTRDCSARHGRADRSRGHDCGCQRRGLPCRPERHDAVHVR